MKAILLQGNSQYDVLNTTTTFFSKAMSSYGIENIICNLNIVSAQEYLEIVKTFKPDFTISNNPICYLYDGITHHEYTNIPHIVRLGDHPYYHVGERALKNPNAKTVFTIAPQQIYVSAFEKLNDINKNLELLNDETLYVLKPSIGRGSADVLFIEGKNLKNKILNNEVQASNVVQEVSFGQEYRVLLIVQNSEIKLLAPLKRENFKNTFFLGKLYFCKDSLNYKRIVEHANKLIKEMNIVNSIIKYDIIVEENKINLIEMDIGVGGGIYFKTFISKIFNIDLTELYLDLICGFPIDVYLPKNTNLMMTYVFNETNKKITYDVEECRNELSLKFGHVELLVNQLRPENKNSFESNADFIFTVIHENDESDGNQWIINDFVNEHLFKVEK